MGLRLRRGLRGDRAGVLAPLDGAERAMAESDEYWSYLMASAYALVGEDDEALGWLEHTVRCEGGSTTCTSRGTTGFSRACGGTGGFGS